MMVEIGAMHLVETLPGESTPLYVLETSAGDRFTVPRPDSTPQQELEILDALRDILQDEDLL